MAIIDIDTHFEPGRAWLDDYPRLKERLPEYSIVDSTVRAIAGDLVRFVPEDRRPSDDTLLPPGVKAILGLEKSEGYGFEGSAMHSPADPVARLAWMDEVGIDATNVLCLEGAGYAKYLDDRDLAREAVSACNDWLADQVAGNEGRLMPATSVYLDDIDAAIAEMTKMRARGSRTFLISPLPADGVPPNDPRFDRLWSAAVDLGMAAQVHVGAGCNAFDPGWSNTDDGTVLRQLGASQGSQAVQLMMNAMVFGGVFHRHPELTLILAEFGVHWFEGTVDHMEQRGPAQPETALYLGPYEFDLTPTEFVRRNIRITPLPRAHQSPLRLMERLPECVVFSSDYAHNESNPAPTAHYDALMAETDPTVRAGFMGTNIAECFARMGDPLAAA